MSDIPDNEKEYVLGFCFEGLDTNHAFVVLITKEKPRWQQGKWNGVGGHTKVGEGMYEAMTREFREETGAHTFVEQWRHFADMTFQDGSIVHCLVMADSLTVARVQTQPGGEQVHRLSREFARFHSKCLDNIRWLMEMGLAKLERPEAPVLTVQYPV